MIARVKLFTIRACASYCARTCFQKKARWRCLRHRWYCEHKFIIPSCASNQKQGYFYV